MTLDEAIKHCEEVYERKIKDAERHYDAESFEESKECIWCAEEHRQLAEWLKELQAYKDLFVKANRDVGNVHLDNRAIFEKFFWDCWGIFKAESEVEE